MRLAQNSWLTAVIATAVILGGMAKAVAEDTIKIGILH